MNSQTKGLEHIDGNRYFAYANDPRVEVFTRQRAGLIQRLLSVGVVDAESAADELIGEADEQSISRILGRRGVTRENLYFLFALHTEQHLYELRSEHRREMEERNPVMTDAVLNRFLPAIRTIATAKYPEDAFKSFIHNLGFVQPKWASELDQSFDYMLKRLARGKGRSDERVLIATDLTQYFNEDLLQRHNFTLVRTHAPMVADNDVIDVNTIIAASIEQRGNFTVLKRKKETLALNYQVVRQIHPLGLPTIQSGNWDVGSFSATVFADACEHSAFRQRETLEQNFPGQPAWKKPSLQRCYDMRGGNEADVAMSLKRSTLCEEVAHGINSLRRLGMIDDAHGKYTYDERRRLYENKRLRDTSVIRTFNKPFLAGTHTLTPNDLSILIQLEETNAKLKEMMIGPNPRASLSDIADGLRHGRADCVTIAFLLSGYASGSVSPAMKKDLLHSHMEQLLMKASDQQLRLLTQTIIQREYVDDMLETPFCTLDEKGNLVRHPGTQDIFAEWA